MGPLPKFMMDEFKQHKRFAYMKFPSDLNKCSSLEANYKKSSLSKSAISLMKGLLAMDPADRFTTEEALMHEYFDDIREPSINF